MHACRRFANLSGRSALRVRQLYGHCSEVTNTFMAADEKIDRVFLLGSSGFGTRYLVQHQNLLSQGCLWLCEHPLDFVITADAESARERLFCLYSLIPYWVDRSNFISTVTCTGMGWPFFSAGLNFHFFTVSTALVSKTWAVLCST